VSRKPTDTERAAWDAEYDDYIDRQMESFFYDGYEEEEPLQLALPPPPPPKVVAPHLIGPVKHEIDDGLQYIWDIQRDPVLYGEKRGETALITEALFRGMRAGVQLTQDITGYVDEEAINAAKAIADETVATLWPQKILIVWIPSIWALPS
jgi:hypothetical protein